MTSQPTHYKATAPTSSSTRNYAPHSARHQRSNVTDHWRLHTKRHWWQSSWNFKKKCPVKSRENRQDDLHLEAHTQPHSTIICRYQNHFLGLHHLTLLQIDLFSGKNPTDSADILKLALVGNIARTVWNWHSWKLALSQRTEQGAQTHSNLEIANNQSRHCTSRTVMLLPCTEWAKGFDHIFNSSAFNTMKQTTTC